ncbi:PKD-like family lipoprotein [uncultured Chitinophaga sp.]|uniref:PKD-like family lipoprotein n=1 Tax=uncultured Chitinophaga sp. TaxID=339340 RepID=UPI0025E9310F|nr:PKD-like family lipoprotein [uncultured Chitinophaga sp.]
MKRFINILVVLACIVPGACMKDKGNYDYHPINRIAIKGVDSLYILDYGSRLTIRPELSFTDGGKEDTANYSYAWVQNRLIGYTGAARVLSTRRDLDTNIRIAYGSYEMYYRVTDKRTNVFTDAVFTLTVGSPSYEGWMALCDMENGNSRLDMVSRRGPLDIIYRNVLDTVRSAFKTTGTPSFISVAYTLIPPGQGTNTTFIGTSTTAALLGRDSLDYSGSSNFNNLFNVNAVKPVDYTGARIYLRIYAGILYAENRLFRVDISNLSVAVNKQDANTALFKPSPYVALGASTSIVFNEDNKTFLRLTSSGASCLTIAPGTLFNYSQPDKDLVWMDFSTYNGGEAFAVLKRPADNKMFLARFLTTGLGQNYYDEIIATDIDKAEHFCVSPEYGYLFYSVGSKVYEYDFALKKSWLMKDYGSKKITIMKFQRFLSLSATGVNIALYTELSRKLAIGTYEEGNPITSGVLDLYTVPGINGNIRIYKSYEGLGKIASLTYRER